MKLKILIPILAIVFVAGCTIPGLDSLGLGGTTLLGGNGLEIVTFTAEPTPIFSGSAVRITAEIENKGGTTVNNSSALVYLTGSNIDIGNTNGDYWYGKETKDRQSIRHFSKEMKPENVVRGTPADIERLYWSLVAPTITPGQTRLDTFILRVYNEYSSGANGNIWVYTNAEAEATRAAGRALRTSSFTTVSGPIAVNVRLTPSAIVLYENENQFTFNIEITNTQSGTIYKSGSIPLGTNNPNDLSLDADTELNHVTVDVDTNGVLQISECTSEQEIFGGRSMTLVCEVTIPTSSTPATFRSYPVNVKVNYGYYTEREASVTVQGKATSTSSSSTPPGNIV